jgi:hypothetical protein
MTLDRFFESYYRLRPVTATFTGIHDHDHRLPDWSPEGLASAADEMRALRTSLAAARAPALSLHDAAERDRELAIAFLDVQLAEHESACFQRRNPSLALGEAIFGVIALMTRPFGTIADRADAAVSRLTAVPAFLEGARRSITAGVPHEWRLKALRECDGADRLLRGGIQRWIAVECHGDALARHVAHHLTTAAERAGAAFDDLRRWLEDASDHDSYACGSDLFDLLLVRGHWCDRSRASLSADAHEALGEALTARIHAVSAAVFILCLAAISFLFAHREKKYNHRDLRQRFHFFCGVTILLAVAWALIGGALKINIGELTPLYVGEIISVWAFGASWFVKGKDLRGILHLSGQSGRSKVGPTSHLPASASR